MRRPRAPCTWDRWTIASASRRCIWCGRCAYMARISRDHRSWSRSCRWYIYRGGRQVRNTRQPYTKTKRHTLDSFCIHRSLPWAGAGSIQFAGQSSLAPLRSADSPGDWRSVMESKVSRCPMQRYQTRKRVNLEKNKHQEHCILTCWLLVSNCKPMIWLPIWSEDSRAVGALSRSSEMSSWEVAAFRQFPILSFTQCR